MGSPDGKEDGQLVVVDMPVSVYGEMQSERKINFMSKAIEIITDVLNCGQSKKQAAYLPSIKTSNRIFGSQQEE